MCNVNGIAPSSIVYGRASHHVDFRDSVHVCCASFVFVFISKHEQHSVCTLLHVRGNREQGHIYDGVPNGEHYLGRTLVTLRG